MGVHGAGWDNTRNQQADESLTVEPGSGRYRVTYEKDGKRLTFINAETWDRARNAVQRLRGMKHLGVTCPRIRILGESK